MKKLFYLVLLLSFVQVCTGAKRRLDSPSLYVVSE